MAARPNFGGEAGGAVCHWRSSRGRADGRAMVKWFCVRQASFPAAGMGAASRKLLCSVDFVFLVLLLTFVGLLEMETPFERWRRADGDAPLPELPQNLSDDYIARYDARDPRLVRHISRYYMKPPASRSTPYVLNDPRTVDFSQLNQSTTVASFLRYRRNGFFIEAGAYDGERFSNSLYFERQLNWTGLLVEPDDDSFRRLVRKRRKTWLLKACLCDSQTARKMKLFRAGDVWSLNDYAMWYRSIGLHLWDRVQVTDVWCFPLVSVLLAINWTEPTVDYLVLDMEGAEMSVLRSLTANGLDVNVLQLETLSFRDVSFGERYSNGDRRRSLEEYVRSHLPEHRLLTSVSLDAIFVKRLANES